jgi:hypothetical protein
MSPQDLDANYLNYFKLFQLPRKFNTRVYNVTLMSVCTKSITPQRSFMKVCKYQHFLTQKCQYAR